MNKELEAIVEQLFKETLLLKESAYYVGKEYNIERRRFLAKPQNLPRTAKIVSDADVQLLEQAALQLERIDHDEIPKSSPFIVKTYETYRGDELLKSFDVIRVYGENSCKDYLYDFNTTEEVVDLDKLQEE